MNFMGKRKQSCLGHSHSGKKEKRELFDGELCEAELKVIWGATSLAVALSDLRRVCGTTPV